MNLYLLKRPDDWSYDEYDSAVVCAESAEAARMIHPSTYLHGPDGKPWDGKDGGRYDSWVAADRVIVELIGTASEGVEAGVVCASFNAG